LKLFKKAVNKTILINNLKTETFDPARALDVQASGLAFDLSTDSGGDDNDVISDYECDSG
jgi:hypothetical protein